MCKSYKLIAVDMDGTLFTSDKRITQRTVDAVKAASAKGVKVVLASGRPLEGLYPSLEQLGLMQEDNYVLAFNGALCITTKTKEPIATTVLKGSDYKKLAGLAEELNLNCHAFSTRQGLITAKSNKYTELESSINKIDIHIVDPIKDIDDDEDIIKVMFIDPPEILDPAITKLPSWTRERYNTFKSAPFFLEFMHKSVDKGTGLKQLADYLHIDREEIIACGDEGNDYSMIKYAGLGVAMGNAIDSVKEIANYITDTNDNDGVAKMIEKFIL